MTHSPFGTWDPSAVPNNRAGVYSIFLGPELIYVGMSGKGMGTHEDSAEVPKKFRGMRERLNSHASGRRSGDQFCVYISDRYVVPGLTAEQLSGLAAGTVLLDRLTRNFIRTNLGYSYVLTEDGASASLLESSMRRDLRPTLNPLHVHREG